YGGHHRHEYHVSLRALEFRRARYLQLTLLKDRRRQHFDQLVLDFLGLTTRGKQRDHTEGLTGVGRVLVQFHKLLTQCLSLRNVHLLCSALVIAIRDEHGLEGGHSVCNGFAHRYKFVALGAIEILVRELDDFGHATVVFHQGDLLRKGRACIVEEGTVVHVYPRVLIDLVEVAEQLFCKALQVASILLDKARGDLEIITNHHNLWSDVLQEACGHVRLRSLVHNHDVKESW